MAQELPRVGGLEQLDVDQLVQDPHHHRLIFRKNAGTEKAGEDRGNDLRHVWQAKAVPRRKTDRNKCRVCPGLILSQSIMMIGVFLHLRAARYSL